MSKIGSVKYIFAALFAFALAFALAGMDISVQAQNTNSSTTTEEPSMQNMNMNANANTNTSRRRGRRGSRGTRRTTNTNTSGEPETGGEIEVIAPASANPGVFTDTDTGASSPGAQADLSGTYTGTINYPEGGMTGEATLTITGGTFTLTSGSTTQSGRISAVTTRGYTGASMQFGDALPATVVSVRAWHTSPDRLRLMSVPGEKREFSFSTPNAGGNRRRRGRRG